MQDISQVIIKTQMDGCCFNDGLHWGKEAADVYNIDEGTKHTS